MNRLETNIRYLPQFARLAIERLDRDNELRVGAKLDELLDGYAKTYGERCDNDTRASAHAICARRFWDYEEVPA